MKYIVLCVLLAAVFTFMAISSALWHSGTCDEIAHHIPSGVVSIVKGDLKMDTSQPPLSRYIIAAPVVWLLKPALPDDSKEWRKEDRAEFGRDFFFKYNNNSKQILFTARMAVVFTGILAGLLIFTWTKQLYGLSAAGFALFLYCFSPDMIAHSGLATTDIINMLFVFLSCYTVWFFMCEPNMLNLFLAGISLGLAELSKYSAIMLYFIFLALFFIAIKKNQQSARGMFWKILIIFALSVIVAWAGYGFSIEPLLKNAMRSDEKLQLLTAMAHRPLPFLINFPIPLGEYILGILGIANHGHAGHMTYFLGKWSQQGSPLYFLTAFLIKTPIPVLLFLISGLVISLRKKFSINEYFIFMPLLVCFIFASISNLQIGIRHLFPIYPFCFIIAGQAVYLWRYKIAKIALPVICAWYLLIAFDAWPNYLSYFNEFAGGPDNGWKYLRDSNIDWGQDLPALSEYMAKNNVKEISLEYFGEDAPHVYNINFRKLSSSEYDMPQQRMYAVSAQYLEHVKWSQNHQPVAKAGKSIFIYDFKDKK
ncbi:MAG: glycosyltransferase family 39 protein [Candidatus Omnitrophica bacterium]|nr:glycosyltransferase family 39 protein [Candidatus Omnitrophota bacterium]